MTRHLRHLALVVLAASLSACAARGGVPRPFPGAELPPSAAERPDPESTVATSGSATPRTPRTSAFPAAPGPATSGIVATALGFLGVPYRNGGSDPSGFDCSGFVQYVFAKLGMSLPREVRDQSRAGRAVGRDEVRAGDLVFFETVSKGPSHVGVALGGDEFVHAPSSRGVVRVERYSSSYWARRFLGARRVQRDAGGQLSAGSR